MSLPSVHPPGHTDALASNPSPPTPLHQAHVPPHRRARRAHPKVADLKRSLWAAHPWRCPRESGDDSHLRLRLYKRAGARTGAVLRDGRTLRQSLSGGFDDKEVAVQLLGGSEQLGEEGLLLRWQLVEPPGHPGK